MNEAEFIQGLRRLSRDCHQLRFRPGDPGPVAVTKLGGQPWWPTGTPRPVCREAGHLMAFVAQVRLRDVPGLEHLQSHLLSFHYCRECTLAGRMSFGWSPLDEEPQPIPWPTFTQRILSRLNLAPLPTIPLRPDSQSYDTSIFTAVDQIPTDRLGVLAEAPVPPREASMDRVSEVPTGLDYPEDLHDPRDPLEFRSAETEIADLVHVRSSKLGGWPSWVHDRQVPPGLGGAPMRFIAQIDHLDAEDASWGGGGYAYLLADLSSPETPFAQLVIQAT